MTRKPQATTAATDSQRPRIRRVMPRLGIAALIVALFAPAMAYSSTSNAHRARASAATRELALHETGTLHLVSHNHEQIVEQGHGSGTLSGNITVKLTLSFSQATVSFTAYPSSGGTVVGRGEGKLYAGGKTANFTGTATITGGTGKYAHASGRGIHLEGTLQRKTFVLNVKVTGTMSY